MLPRFCNPTYPTEAFVLKAAESYLVNMGFERLRARSNTLDRHIDLICKHPDTGQRWVVEGKGKSWAPSVAFHEGLGQLVHRWSDPGAYYGLALPVDRHYLRLCSQMESSVRQSLRLHLLLVDPEGGVRVYRPDEVLNSEKWKCDS